MPAGIFGVPSLFQQLQSIRTEKRSQKNWQVKFSREQFANG
jgi:hypothetical protein